MNLIELKTILEATGYPVAYFHFVETENEPLPKPPFHCLFICLFIKLSWQITKCIFQLKMCKLNYTQDKKDLEAEAKLASGFE